MSLTCKEDEKQIMSEVGAALLCPAGPCKVTTPMIAVHAPIRQIVSYLVRICSRLGRSTRSSRMRMKLYMKSNAFRGPVNVQGVTLLTFVLPASIDNAKAPSGIPNSTWCNPILDCLRQI